MSETPEGEGHYEDEAILVPITQDKTEVIKENSKSKIDDPVNQIGARIKKI